MAKEKTAKKEAKAIARQNDFGELYNRVREILELARKRTARSVNFEMVQAYWLVGQAIVEQEQQGQSRADYGEKLIVSLAEQMKSEGLKGFGRNNLWYMRQFYLKFPEKLHALRGELSWTHYRLLLKVISDAAREYYEKEAAEENWSTRELGRQINSRFYEFLRTRSGFQRKTANQKRRQKADRKIPAAGFYQRPVRTGILKYQRHSRFNRIKTRTGVARPFAGIPARTRQRFFVRRQTEAHHD